MGGHQRRRWRRRRRQLLERRAAHLGRHGGSSRTVRGPRCSRAPGAGLGLGRRTQRRDGRLSIGLLHGCGNSGKVCCKPLQGRGTECQHGRVPSIDECAEPSLSPAASHTATVGATGPWVPPADTCSAMELVPRSLVPAAPASTEYRSWCCSVVASDMQARDPGPLAAAAAAATQPPLLLLPPCLQPAAACRSARLLTRAQSLHNALQILLDGLAKLAERAPASHQSPLILLHRALYSRRADLPRSALGPALAAQCADVLKCYEARLQRGEDATPELLAVAELALLVDAAGRWGEGAQEALQLLPGLMQLLLRQTEEEHYKGVAAKKGSDAAAAAEAVEFGNSRVRRDAELLKGVQPFSDAYHRLIGTSLRWGGWGLGQDIAHGVTARLRCSSGEQQSQSG